MLHLFDLFFAPSSLAVVGIKARVQFIIFTLLVTLVQQVTRQEHTQAHICLKIMQEHTGHIWYLGYIPRLWGGDISKTPSAKQSNYELSFNKCSAWYSFLLKSFCFIKKPVQFCWQMWRASYPRYSFCLNRGGSFHIRLLTLAEEP
jgi:hypothetical protein